MRLHEQTQRTILLLIFYLFGPILTLGIIGGIVLRKHPSHARTWERTLFQTTGIPCTIQSVEYRSPNLIRLHNVDIFGEAIENPIFNAPHIDIQRVTDPAREKFFPGIAAVTSPQMIGLTDWFIDLFPSLRSTDWYWQISIPCAIVNFGTLSSDASAQCVQNLLRKVGVRLETFSDVPIQFVLEKIVVASEYSLKKPGDKPEDKIDLFRFVRGNIYRTPTEIRSDWSFQIKEVSEVEREQLSFVLSDTLTVAFQTGKQPILCDLAAVFCSMFKHFSGGTFQGGFTLESHLDKHSQTVRLDRAAFKNIPLAPLARSFTDFAVAGTISELQFDQAEFGPEKFFAQGNLGVVNGAMEMSLLHRCVDKFQLTVKPETILDSKVPMIPFSASIIHFRLLPQGVEFWSDAKWRDAIIENAGNNHFPLWTVYLPPQRRMASLYEFLSIFAQDGTPVVPLSRGIQSILPHLPIK